jgi:hypothetical protein
MATSCRWGVTAGRTRTIRGAVEIGKSQRALEFVLLSDIELSDIGAVCDRPKIAQREHHNARPSFCVICAILGPFGARPLMPHSGAIADVSQAPRQIADAAAGLAQLPCQPSFVETVPDGGLPRSHGFHPPLPYGRVMISSRWPFGSSK